MNLIKSKIERDYLFLNRKYFTMKEDIFVKLGIKKLF